jgi:oligopeptide/dipeptide ABC transporter ATP-binding protein
MSVNHLEVKDLKTYIYTRWGVVKAVDGVSLTIKERETFGLVGESGCGKSMTALSIIRLVPKPAGRIVGGQILLHGEDLLTKSEAEIRKIRGTQISMILQDPMTSLDPVFSIGQQLTEAIAMQSGLKRQGIRARAIELLKSVRIPAPERRLQNYPHEMSGGMRQRVLGAIALSRQPHLLIADEPTTSLDVTTQANYLRLLKTLQEEFGLTMLFITHDFGIVARMCHRVGVMYAGRLVEVADVREIFNNPAHPYTKALLESVPKLDKRVDRLASIKGQPPVLHNLPPGCLFRPRCPTYGDTCGDKYPTMVDIGSGHLVSCWGAAKQVVQTR